MTTLVGTLGRAAEPSRLMARLGAALDWLLARWPEQPSLIPGDSDSALLAIARDLESEARLLYHARA